MLEQLILFDPIGEDEWIQLREQLITQLIPMKKRDDYYRLVRFLLNEGMSFRSYCIFKLIATAKEKVLAYSSVREGSPVRSEREAHLEWEESTTLDRVMLGDKARKRLAHDMAIIRDFLAVTDDMLANKYEDEEGLMDVSDVEADMPPLMKQVLNVYIDAFMKGDVEAFERALHQYGIGEYALYKGFKLQDNGTYRPLHEIEGIEWEEIYSYAWQKEALYENTKQFVEGLPAQHALLVGASGTGKSSSVKAVVNAFTDRKLRLIQLGKNQLNSLPKIMERIKGSPFKFILFMDDLSFEANEDDYKFLKSFMEGSIGGYQPNCLFYVTSNRRHLIKEVRTERENDIHLQDFIHEMTSLSDRFGLTLIYESLEQRDYQDMILQMAKDEGIDQDDEELLIQAKKYALRHGKMSGRVAAQFIRSYKNTRNASHLKP